jgi:hypothetical protein
MFNKHHTIACSACPLTKQHPITPPPLLVQQWTNPPLSDLKHLALEALHRNWDPTKSEDYYIILCALQSITYESPPLSNP